MHPIIPINDRIYLREWKVTDIDSLILNANNYLIWKWLRNTFPHPYTYSDAAFWVETGQYASSQLNFAIVYEEIAIGGIGIIFKDDIYTLRAEIGYWIGQSYQGLGITTACLKHLTEWSFQNYHLARIEAPVIAGNEPSMRILEKSGYHLEAIHRFGIFKENEVKDEYFYVKYAPSLVN